MSLTAFLKMTDVIAKVKSLRPKGPRKIDATLKIAPRSKRYMLVGTAFDYLLRFELQRRAPHARSEGWVAERAPRLIWKETAGGGVGVDLFHDAAPENYLSPKEIAERATRIIADARAAVDAYVKNVAPTRAVQADLSAHAVRLANLDSVYRAQRLDPHFEEVAAEDVADLVEMLAIVPYDQLVHPKLMLLDPDFGETSRLMRGADTDLITDDLLLDFKTTVKSEVKADNLDQILGYLLLARKQHQTDPAFPVINRLGLYFCRHGYLWSMPATIWTDCPEFPEIEQWFFKRAGEVFGGVTNRDAPAVRR